MYRVITSASKILAALSSSELKTKMADLRADMRLLSRCDTYDDVIANADNFREMNVPNLIDRHMQKGMDFDEAYDEVLDSLTQLMHIGKREHGETSAKEKKMDELSAKLAVSLKRRYPDIVQVDPYKFYLVPEVADHQACIAFADNVADLINGNYYGTGRGGSWTTWNMRSAEGVAVNVGWSGHKSWAPEDSFVVEIVYNN